MSTIWVEEIAYPSPHTCAPHLYPHRPPEFNDDKAAEKGTAEGSTSAPRVSRGEVGEGDEGEEEEEESESESDGEEIFVNRNRQQRYMESESDSGSESDVEDAGEGDEEESARSDA